MRRVALALSVALLVGCSVGGEDFDPDRWRQARAEGCDPDNQRLAMYGDLRSDLMARRPARATVLEVLGPPDGERRDTVEYMLGLNIIDCDSVDIDFAPRGGVSDVRYVQG